MADWWGPACEEEEDERQDSVIAIKAPPRRPSPPAPKKAGDEKRGRAEDPALSAPVPTDADELRPVSVPLTAGAVFLAMAAAAWMLGGPFRGLAGRPIALAGVLLGVGIIALSYRSRYTSALQYLLLPAAVALGAVIALWDAGGSGLVEIVADALRSGGLAQPPIPLDPGWRFILVVVMAVMSAAGTSLAIGLQRPMLGVFAAAPLLFAAAFVQPREAAVLASGVGLALFVSAMALGYGAQLAREGTTTGSFEARRLARSALIIALVMVLLGALSRLGFLFPEPADKERTPPKAPAIQPLDSQKLLFSVKSPRPGPWRLGVLDVYDGKRWLIPPFDRERLKDVPRSGRVGHRAGRETYRTEVTMAGAGGHAIPTVAGVERILPPGLGTQFDPRTESMRLSETRAAKGLTYTLVAAVPPSGAELAKAPAPPRSLKRFTDVPFPPSAVSALLDGAPQASAWDRLQYVRNAFYEKAVAAGTGRPGNVTPARVIQILSGDEANPYEITAAEVLLARWAGVPARIGYGYYSGDKADPASDRYDVHPKHGSSWLEAYFQGYGWLPIMGQPAQAKASLSREQKLTNPNVRPSDELAVVAYIPVKVRNAKMFYQVVRYWLLVALPFVAGGLLVWAFYPALLKQARRVRRRVWAHKTGMKERIAASYCDLRDLAADLNIETAKTTPLEFMSRVQADPEHEELAWLVTRSLWGDLQRDLTDEEAEAAELMARSVGARLRRAQPPVVKLISFSSRVSLRDPYSAEVPNLWPEVGAAVRARAGIVRRSVKTRSRGLVRSARRLLPTGTVLCLALAMVMLSACGGQGEARSDLAQKVVLPERLAPSRLGRLEFVREPKVEKSFTKERKESLVQKGRVFTIRQGPDVIGYFQIAAFKPGIGSDLEEVREGVLNGIATGNFELVRVGRERIFVTSAIQQKFLIWFPPNGRYFQLLVARDTFGSTEELFAAILAYQRTGKTTPSATGPTLIDPRRGGDL